MLCQVKGEVITQHNHKSNKKDSFLLIRVGTKLGEEGKHKTKMTNRFKAEHNAKVITPFCRLFSGGLSSSLCRQYHNTYRPRLDIQVFIHCCLSMGVARCGYTISLYMQRLRPSPSYCEKRVRAVRVSQYSCVFVSQISFTPSGSL